MSTVSQPPGSREPTAEALWRSGQYEVALTSLAAGVLGGTGVLVLTGEPGTGKTALTHGLTTELEREGVVVGRLLYPVLEELDFLSGIAEAFGLSGAFTTRVEFDVAFDRFAASTRERGARLLLIVDDAQSLPASSLREIARLTRSSVNGVRALSVLLAGHESLSEAARTAGIESSSVAHVRPLTLEESLEYMRHRLRLTTGTGGALSAAVMERICRDAGGIPQVINVLCQQAAADRSRCQPRSAVRDRSRRRARRGARAPSARLTRSRGAVITIVAITLATVGTTALALTRLAHRREHPAVSAGVPGSGAPREAAEPPRNVTAAPEPPNVTPREAPDAPRNVTTGPEPSNVANDVLREPAKPAEIAQPVKRDADGVARPSAPRDRGGVAQPKSMARRDREEAPRPVAQAITREPARSAPPERRSVDDGAANDPGAIIDWMLKDHRPTPGGPLE